MKKISSDLWKKMFFVGSLWNISIGIVGFIFYDFCLKLLFGAGVQTDNLLTMIFFRFFMIAVIIFGAGYWAVSRDLSANRAVVWMGLTAKVIIFFTFLYYYMLGQAGWFSVFGSSGDFAFAILFMIFLYQTRGGSKA